MPEKRVWSSIKTVCLCLGSTGPLYAGYMLAGGYSWRLFFYVEAAFAGALLIMAFFFVEESTYHRKEQSTTSNYLSHSPTVHDTDEKLEDNVQLENVSSTSVPSRKSFLATLKPWGSIDPEPEFFMTIVRSFSYFLVPAVFWVIASYGMSPWKVGVRVLFLFFADHILQVSTLAWGPSHLTTLFLSRSLSHLTTGAR